MSAISSEQQAKKRYLKLGQRERSIERRLQSLNKKLPGKRFNSTQIAFTFYVIAIAAKLAKLNPQPNSNYTNEIESFKEIFSIPDSEIPKVEAYYMAALSDTVDATHYAKQIINLFPHNKLLLEELVNDLMVFADADSPFNSEKARFLKHMVLAFNLHENYFKRVLRQHLIRYDKDPFILLGVPRNVSYVDLKKCYRKAVRDCHPDKFAAGEQVPELIEIATDQFGHYTKAYEAIKDKRGFNRKNVD